MTDLASKLAADVFNRIEREHKCQLHIIEDELRCRLPTNGRGAQSMPQPIIEEAKKLVSLFIYDLLFFDNVPKQVRGQLLRLLNALNKEGHVV